MRHLLAQILSWHKSELLHWLPRNYSDFSQVRIWPILVQERMLHLQAKCLHPPPLPCHSCLCLCQREEGRQCLRALLQWEEFDDVRDLRRSIELDSLYSSIVFAVEKGLSWPAVVEAGKLAEELLNETKGAS